MSQHEQLEAMPEFNGDLPAGEVEEDVRYLIRRSSDLRERKEVLTTELASISKRLSRYDSAIKALTREDKPIKARGKAERGKVREYRRKNFDPAITKAAPNYPSVSEERQQVVLDALAAMGEPASPTQLLRANAHLNKSTVGNALAHLRARGLVRWAGKGKAGGHLYAPWNEGDTEVTD